MINEANVRSPEVKVRLPVYNFEVTIIGQGITLIVRTVTYHLDKSEVINNYLGHLGNYEVTYRRISP